MASNHSAVCLGVTRRKMTIHRTIVSTLVLCGTLTFSMPAQGYSAVVGVVLSCTDEQAATQEAYFRDHPRDTERAMCLLDYYALRLGWPGLQARRLWLIRWIIKNHPEVRDCSGDDARI